MLIVLNTGHRLRGEESRETTAEARELSTVNTVLFKNHIDAITIRPAAPPLETLNSSFFFTEIIITFKTPPKCQKDVAVKP